MQINDIISIDIKNGEITIKADPKLARDLVYILSSLLDLSHTLRAKIIHARAIASAFDKLDMQKRQNDFQLKSSEIFIRFQEHLIMAVTVTNQPLCNANNGVAVSAADRSAIGITFY
jgi:hypothetical protein